MTDNENFDDKLGSWTLDELRIEVTRGDVYSPKKLARIQSRIAELETMDARGGQEPEAGTSGGANKGVLIAVIAVIVIVIAALFLF